MVNHIAFRSTVVMEYGVCAVRDIIWVVKDFLTISTHNLQFPRGVMPYLVKIMLN